MSPGAFAAALQRVVAWGALVVVFFIPMAVATQPRVTSLDFAAFYCAGEAVAQHADPYRAMPLGACERRVSRNGLILAGGVMPAPLPPYALGAFALLSRLPFEPAEHVFDLLSFAALLLSIRLVSRTTRRPEALVACAFVPIAWLVVVLGQTLILLLAALSAAGFLLDRNRDRWAALCACAMMAEPHLGLPVCVALFLYRPRTRLILISAAALIALVSFTAIPWSLTREYLGVVLPLHAMSEARAVVQISFTSLLTFFGVSDLLAIALGGAQYVATAALGILIARGSRSPSALAFVPALFALVGGSFLHADDLLLGIPAALMFWEKHPLVAALAIVAVSPHWGVDGGAIGLVAMVPAVILLAYAGISFRRALLAVAVLVLVVLLYPVPVRSTIVVPPFPPAAAAERSWAAWEAANPRRPWWPLTNLPDWLGIIAVCSLAGSAIVFPPRRCGPCPP